MEEVIAEVIGASDSEIVVNVSASTGSAGNVRSLMEGTQRRAFHAVTDSESGRILGFVMVSVFTTFVMEQFRECGFCQSFGGELFPLNGRGGFG